jgi:hypothetical protein
MLGRPVGWLETTAFDRTSLAPLPAPSVAPPSPSVTPTRVSWGGSRITLGLPTKALPVVFIGSAVLFALFVWKAVTFLRGIP